MTRRVLTDTGPLYALADPSDQYHARARKELEKMESAGYHPAAAHPTICEAYTLVVQRLGTAYAHRWIEEVLNGVSAVNPEPRDYLEAVQCLLRYSDQAVTLFDAVVFCLTQRLKIPVWAYDHHFDLMGARRWQL